jgi:hypothetical protein
MGKYILIVGELKDIQFFTLIDIKGDTIAELLAKLSLEIHRVDMLAAKEAIEAIKIERIDDDIPF